MTARAAATSARSSGPLWRALLADRHFLVAAAVLAVTAAGWEAATAWLGIHAQKQPVEWPSGVTVSGDFRLASLADELPALDVAGAVLMDANGKPIVAFKRVLPNVELSKADPNHRDWEVLSDTDLETLSIGTSVDKGNLAKRCCNWYASRVYRDTRAGAPVGEWRLQVFYYTGGGDTVPHVPEICAAAGGAKVLDASRIQLAVQTVPEPWSREIPFTRTRYIVHAPRDSREYYSADYYTFSMNGAFSDSRLWVRWELLNPFIRCAYFAKMQFGPAWPSAGRPDGPAALALDRAAEDFLRHVLPEVLKALPSRLDVQRQEQSR
jgi:hypothetical protein